MSDATQCSDPIEISDPIDLMNEPGKFEEIPDHFLPVVIQNLQSRIRKLEAALHRAVVLLDKSWQGTSPDATLEDRIAEGKAIDKGIKLLIKDTEEITGVSDGG